MRPFARAGVSAALIMALATPALAGGQPNYDMVHAGRYQAILSDCMGCHTAPGGKAFAGGLMLQTPFGTLATPNITSDKQTGIGNWTEEEFRRAVKEGIGPGGRRLYPAMPYTSYALMSDQDIARLFAYMQTLNPVKDKVRVNLLHFPFNIRSLMAVWNWLYFKPAPFKPEAGKSAMWNRGAYIVTGPGHCGDCHTARNMLGAPSGTPLAGALVQGWFAPDITADAKRGVGGWSVRDIVTYLKTGHNSHSMASGPMAEAIEDSTSHMTDADLVAIGVYLKNVPGAGNATGSAVAANDARMTAGAAIYQDNCQACHGTDGKGESNIFPPLAGNPIVRQAKARTLARVVLAGTQSAQTAMAPTASAMPSFAWRLDDAQVANVLIYIRNSWGNSAGAVSESAVRQTRESFRR